MMYAWTTRIALTTGLLVVSNSSLAHLGTTDGGATLTGGLLHLFTEPAQFMLLMALALAVGQQPAGHRVRPVVSFAFALALSLAIAVAGHGVTMPAWVTMITLGVAMWVVVARPLPDALAMTIAVVAAIAIANDTVIMAIAAAGSAVVGPMRDFMPLIGVWLGVTAMLAVVVLAARRFVQSWQRMAVRIVGAWITAGALMNLALQWRGLRGG